MSKLQDRFLLMISSRNWNWYRPAYKHPILLP